MGYHDFTSNFIFGRSLYSAGENHRKISSYDAVISNINTKCSITNVIYVSYDSVNLDGSYYRSHRTRHQYT